jgi:XRE family aerobic/anaerobic benzoate catabolism transcriptional regulator
VPRGAVSPAAVAADGFAALARQLGERVRAARGARAQTVAELAIAAGLSRRFLTDVELGKANVSLQGLSRIAAALGAPLAALLDAPPPQVVTDAAERERAERERIVALARQLPPHALRDGAARLAELAVRRAPPPRFALVGLRGAGKSSIGRTVANRVGLTFV